MPCKSPLLILIVVVYVWLRFDLNRTTIRYKASIIILKHIKDSRA
jgi:hypothetical protein